MDEAKELYDSYHVAAPGVALMQMANANLNPRTEAKLDPANPDSGWHEVADTALKLCSGHIGTAERAAHAGGREQDVDRRRLDCPAV